MTAVTTPSEALYTDEETLVTDHLPLVGYLVSEALSRLPGHVSRSELVSAGMLALAEAARSFDPSRGVPFGKYATLRIRGRVIDELRSHDWASRSVRAKARRRDSAEEELALRLGRMPTPQELAEHMGVSLTELFAMDEDLHRALVLSLDGFSTEGGVDELLPPSRSATPEEEILHREKNGLLVDAVDLLPERLRHVIVGFFFEDKTVAQLAAELEVTESRISQIRTEALGLLREAMQAQLSPELLPDERRPNGCVARRKAAYFAEVAAHSTVAARVSAAPRELHTRTA